MSNTERFILFGIMSLINVIYVFVKWFPTWNKINIYNKIIRIILFSSVITYAYYLFKIFQEWVNTAKPYIGIGKMIHVQLAEIFLKEVQTNYIFLGSIILTIITAVLSYYIKDEIKKDFPKEMLKTK
jgi:Ca2+/Na+ antiporter